MFHILEILGWILWVRLFVVSLFSIFFQSLSDFSPPLKSFWIYFNKQLQQICGNSSRVNERDASVYISRDCHIHKKIKFYKWERSHCLLCIYLKYFNLTRSHVQTLRILIMRIRFNLYAKWNAFFSAMFLRCKFRTDTVHLRWRRITIFFFFPRLSDTISIFHLFLPWCKHPHLLSGPIEIVPHLTRSDLENDRKYRTITVNLTAKFDLPVSTLARHSFVDVPCTEDVYREIAREWCSATKSKYKLYDGRSRNTYTAIYEQDFLFRSQLTN